MTVFSLKVGESAQIERLVLSESAKARLNSLGIYEGSAVTSLGFSLFKSSILLSCGAVRVAMRKSLAEKIYARGLK